MFGIFALAIIFICGFVFIINYNIAYDDDSGAGWLPPSFAVIFYYFWIVITSIIAAIVLKIAFKKRVRILVLLLSAILLPIICYNFNYHTLKRDGSLYFLMDKGGIFHFIAIEDYNFDGITDKHYEIETQKRTVRYTGAGVFHPEILSISSEKSGIGYIDSNYVLIEIEENYDFYYCYGCSPKTTYDSVFIDITFRSADLTENSNIYMVDLETLDRTELNTEKLNETTLRIKIGKEQFASFDGSVYEYFYFDLV